VADQSDCAGVVVGVGLGLGLTEADGTGEGDCPDVEKFGLSALLLGNGLGVGTVMDWGRIVLTLAGVAAVCAPAFVFAVLFVPAREFVPICVASVELPPEAASPGAAPPVIPPVRLLIPICAPAFIPVCAPTFVFTPVFVPLRAFIPVWAALVELPLETLGPPAAPPMIPPVGLVIPVCAPAFIPMCAATFVFGPVLMLLRKFVPSWAPPVELPLKPLCPANAGIVVVPI
jgi:hypothetical protein